ncbi:MAG: tRNA 5-methoxyuridine(34)/uridine 5-oxyacetic acid(34) synthase CmoB [Cocleimonas sp.]
MLFDFDDLYADLIANDFSQWQESLPAQLDKVFAQRQHGKTKEWQEILSGLPEITPSEINLNTDILLIGNQQDVDSDTRKQLEELLKQLHPWRKGPYNLFGIHIDTEWHSDWKWQRIRSHLAPLENRRVLDIGCGNGYHMWRILGEGAKLVIGADPSQFFLVQFATIKKYIEAANGKQPVHLLPFKGEELPAFNQKFKGRGFDTVFSMGVLYHRISPIEHLQELKTFLRPGGELLLETLIIESQNENDHSVLLPQDRYAKMRNVWFLPTPELLIRMLERVGFKNVRIVDISQTSIEEQRKTDWMTFESLTDFLDPDDQNKTIEGYPAPKRAAVLCNT